MERNSSPKSLEDAANELLVPAVSLQRWCVLLEWNGYAVAKRADGARQFAPQDLTVIKELKQRLMQGHMLVPAIKELAEKYTNGGSTTPSVSAAPPSPTVAREEIIDIVNQQIETQMHQYMKKTDNQLYQLQTLTNHLDVEFTVLKVKHNKMMEKLRAQEEKVDDAFASIDEYIRTRDEEVTVLIREMLETKRMVAAAKEKKWWKMIWKLIPPLT
ncbi:DUF3967 domain-containing protein [Paenibacillus cremeus]|nr:DUF3967 domain-containing protein [Paenibacillus cremeus]